MSTILARRIAGFLGFFGVLLGAFGAHFFHGLLEKSGTTQVWQTGVLYHLVHAAVLLFISGRRPVPRAAFYLMFGGVLFFSGSLYLLALTNLKWLGAVTPLGGLGILAGWLFLALAKGEQTD
jgi:uncharacterized membrane protein YgdD (TMEM256/DUF423 family)